MSDYKENAKAIQELLDKRKLNYDIKEVDGRVRFTMGLSGFGGLLDRLTFILIVDDRDAQCYALLPVSAKECLSVMAEFVLRANFGLKYGTFEMSYPEGELMFHMTYPVCALGGHENDGLDLLLGVPVAMIKGYGKYFVEIIEGKMTPEVAVSACKFEMNQSPRS